MNYPYQPTTNILPLLGEQEYDFESLCFSLDKPVPEPVPVLAIGGKIICTAGNLSILAGQAKSGKSAVMMAILAATLALPGDATVDVLALQVAANPKYLAVLHFDTEQSEFHQDKSFRGAYRRVSRSQNTDYFRSFNLRIYSLTERRQFVEKCLAFYAEVRGGIFFWVLDGVADMVSSPNDEAEVNEVIEWATKLCIKYNCPMITVLHYNPGTDKARGHLGSSLERKCESYLQVVKIADTTLSQLTAKIARSTHELLVPAINFEYDEQKGYHVTRQVISPQHRADAKEHDKKVKQEAEVENTRLELTENFSDIFEACFPEGLARRVDVIDAWMDLIGGSKRTAESRIKTALNMQILEKGDLEKYKLISKKSAQ